MVRVNRIGTGTFVCELLQSVTEFSLNRQNRITEALLYQTFELAEKEDEIQEVG